MGVLPVAQEDNHNALDTCVGIPDVKDDNNGAIYLERDYN